MVAELQVEVLAGKMGEWMQALIGRTGVEVHTIVMQVCLYLMLQHEEEPPQGVGKESSDQAEKLSKAALKNKRKREAKQRSKDHEVHVSVWS